MNRHLSRLSHLTRWRTLRWVVSAPALLFALWACNANDLQRPNPLPEQQNDQYFDLNPVRDVDILFAIDNSPSMEQEQANVRQNFRVFMDELKKIPGGLPNVNIGVISSDLGAGTGVGTGACSRQGGDRGIFQTKPACGLAAGANFLTSYNNETQNNFMGDISTVFSCMGDLGIRGCGFEHQLQAARVALYEAITPENMGFLRRDAYLAIIFITDEDDCSGETNSDLYASMEFPGTTSSYRCAKVGHVCNGAEPPMDEFSVPLASCMPKDGGRLIRVTEIVDSIRALKARPADQILVSGIFGWPLNATNPQPYRYIREREGLDVAPICESAGNGVAYPGLRMKQFVDSFGDSGTFFSICEDDFAPALKKIGEKLAARLGTTCVNARLIDLDRNMPDVQADCQVVDKLPTGKDEVLPPCSKGRSASGACWKLTGDGGCTESGYKVDVDRGGMNALPNTRQTIKCRTCARPDDTRCM
jgi:hypothetical protein